MPSRQKVGPVPREFSPQLRFREIQNDWFPHELDPSTDVEANIANLQQR